MFESQRFCGNVLSGLAQLCRSILSELLGSSLVFKRPFPCATCPPLILRVLMRTCRSGQMFAGSAISVFDILQKCIGFNLFDWDIWFLSAITNFFD